jgi:excisionase family DNA binding protein
VILVPGGTPNGMCGGGPADDHVNLRFRRSRASCAGAHAGRMTINEASEAPDPRRFMSSAEAAVFLGVSDMTIKRRIKDGSLTAYKLGARTVRVDREELEAFLNANRVAGIRS